MSHNHEITRSAGLIGMLTLLSRIAGMVRDMVIASFFGASMVADAFVVAFSIPNTLRQLVGEGSMVGSFVPVFTEYLHQRSKPDALRLAQIAFTFLTLFLLVMTLLGILLSKYVILVLAPGFRDIPGKTELAILFTQEMFPFLFFIGLVALATGVLNSFSHFSAPAFAPVLFNLATICLVPIFHDRFRQPGLVLAVAVLVGGFLQLALQIPVLWKHGLRFRPDFNFSHPALVRIGKLMLPSILGVAVYQLNVLIATVFVSPFPGGRTFVYYADRLIQFPLGIFAISIGTAILPTLSRLAAKQDFPALSDAFAFGLRLVAFVIFPAALGLALLRVPIVEIIFERREFTHADTLNTAQALLFFALGLPAFSGLRVVVPAYYSLQDTRTPMRVAAVAMLGNVLGCWLLTKTFRHAGVSLSIALAGYINLSLLLLVLRRRLNLIFPRAFALALGRSALACAPVAIVAELFARLPLWHQPGAVTQKLLDLGAAIAICIALYLVVGWLLKSQELTAFVDILRRRLAGRRPA